MPSYLVTITSTILVEAENKTEAEVTAAGCFDFGSADFDTEEICDDDFQFTKETSERHTGST